MILLTGAAGFIGSNVLKALNYRGRDDILCVDDLTDGRKIQNLNGSKYYYYCDYRDLGKGKTREIKLDAIIHLGANADTAATDGRAMMLNNYSFSIDMLDLAVSSACPFIYASSAAVYGNDRRQPAPLTENIVSANLKAPYAYSKLAFDQYVESWGPLSGPRIVGLRFFNVYGPGEAHKGRMASVVHHMFNQIKNGDRPTLFEGSKDIYRDFVYIDDVVQVVLWALKEAPSGIYNVGTGRARSFYELFEAVEKSAYTHAAGCKFVSFPEELRAQYQFYTQADLTRLRAAGYTKEFISLENGVALYWQNS
jgi:ADP-L-glycero-D-manno-heptose 6-epimerase